MRRKDVGSLTSDPAFFFGFRDDLGHGARLTESLTHRSQLIGGQPHARLGKPTDAVSPPRLLTNLNMAFARIVGANNDGGSLTIRGSVNGIHREFLSVLHGDRRIWSDDRRKDDSCRK